MIYVTDSAAEQIRVAAERSDVQGLPLRIAASRRGDGSIDYVMGFDEVRDNDQSIKSLDVTIVYNPVSAALMEGMTMDYVEIEPGKKDFIFLNPNDPHYVKPEE